MMQQVIKAATVLLESLFMKSKRIRYILVFLVIIVWSVIFYRIYNYVGEQKDFIPDFSEQKLQQDKSSANDTFSIIANYRDPFLETGNYYEQSTNKPIQNNTNNSIKIQNDNLPASTATLRWPSIIFGGIVVNKGSNQTVGLIKLNQIQYIVQTKQIVENIEIVKIFNDSIIIRFSNEIKTIKKSK